MLKKYLPNEIYVAINRALNFKDINEIRLRIGCPIIICVKNQKFYLGEFGVTEIDKALICTNEMLQDFVYKICDKSVYAVNDSLKMGYITLPYGIRVGICGEIVMQENKIVTIKNFSSANIRIPHFIRNCSLNAMEYIYDSEFKNTLILSKPGAGKTTFLRDVIYQLSKNNISYNVLLADERGEVASVVDGKMQIDLGAFVDVYSYCSKKFAFEQGIRSMRPDIFVTDEINIDNDLQPILDATNSGVKVLATLHCDSIKQLREKKGFDIILENKIFDRFVLLSDIEGPGTLLGIYDARLQCLYCRC